MIPKKEWSSMRKLMAMGAVAGGKLVEATATGNPLTFTTEKTKPLRSLLIPFTPVQSGTGDPSPDNVRPITGWTGVTVNHSGADISDPTVYPVTFPAMGKNLLKPYPFTVTRHDTTFTYNADGSIRVSAENCQGWRYMTTPGDAYIKLPPGNYILSYNAITNVQAYITDRSGTLSDNSGKFTLTEETEIKLQVLCKSAGEIDAVLYPMLNEGSTAQPYEPFTNTVYGGTLDLVTGVLTVEWVSLTKTWGDFTNKTSLGDNTRGTLNISSYPSKPSSEAVDAKCNIALRNTGWSTDSIHFYTNEGNCIVFLPNGTADSTEIQVVYPLATPITIGGLDPVTINALKGVNTIWSDANGDIEVTYLKKG